MTRVKHRTASVIVFDEFQGFECLGHQLRAEEGAIILDELAAALLPRAILLVFNVAYRLLDFLDGHF